MPRCGSVCPAFGRTWRGRMPQPCGSGSRRKQRYWHCTDERFTAEEYIRANCEYPGDWEGAVERAEWTEDGCVSVTAVWPKDRSARFHAVSFFRFAEDRITRLDEYWADDGPPPQWRKEKHIGSSIGRS